MARGTIINRGTKEKPNYSVVLEGERNQVTGKRKQHWYPGYKTTKEAEQAKTTLLHQMDTGRFVEQSRMTVKELIDEWLDATKDNVKISTWQNYRANMDLHVIPEIGAKRVQKLTASNLNALYDRLRKEGKKTQKKRRKKEMDGKPACVVTETPKPLSPKTVRNIHNCVSGALSYAVRHNIVVKNVALDANPPKPSACAHSEMPTWTASELKQFLDGTEDRPDYPAYLLAATTGMRRGEVLGLRWKDIDLEAKTLSIRQTLLSVGYVKQLSEPKTDKSRRNITLDDYTVAALKSYKARKAEERLAKGPTYSTSGFVFTDESGEPLHPDRFSKVFRDLVAKSGLPRIRLHDLRHTWATLALRQGIHPKVVSERLGHSSISMTMDVYSHAIPALQKEAADQVAALVFES